MKIAGGLRNTVFKFQADMRSHRMRKNKHPEEGR